MKLGKVKNERLWYNRRDCIICEKGEREEVEDDYMAITVVRYSLISYPNKLHTEEFHCTVPAIYVRNIYNVTNADVESLHCIRGGDRK